jgi:hypothetical protein
MEESILSALLNLKMAYVIAMKEPSDENRENYRQAIKEALDAYPEKAVSHFIAEIEKVFSTSGTTPD